MNSNENEDEVRIMVECHHDHHPSIEGVTFDGSDVITMPRSKGESTDQSSVDFDDHTCIHRGRVREDRVDDTLARASDQDGVVGAYVDPVIEAFEVCPGGPIGTDDDVKEKLSVSSLHDHGMDGNGDHLAIVDTGLNVDFLHRKGADIYVDRQHSWSDDGLNPGEMKVSHGSMVAYDASLVAPEATYLDVPLLSHPDLQGYRALLSTAIRSYRHIMDVIREKETDHRSVNMVVNNSWGLYRVTDRIEENYAKNPDHPFNRIVGSLEEMGADITFAAGNCGSETCSGGRCGQYGDTIYGANAHPDVTTVGAATVEDDLISYSSRGPGYLDENKPDVCGYSHFKGSGVYSADSGTSAASPIVAGMIASIRSELPYRSDDPSTSPEEVRNMIRRTARDRGPKGFDRAWGHGLLDGDNLLEELKGDVPDDSDDDSGSDQSICQCWSWFQSLFQ